MMGKCFNPKKYQIYCGLVVVVLVFQFVLALRFHFLYSKDETIDQKASSSGHVEHVKYRNNASIVATNIHPKTSSLVDDCGKLGKAAQSAIHRATTSYCKQLIATVECKSKTGTLYPNILPNYCQNKTWSKYSSTVGCAYATNLLQNEYVEYSINTSTSSCVQYCLQRGYRFGGVSHIGKCYCGNMKPLLFGGNLSDPLCALNCSTDKYFKCDANMITLYKVTHVESAITSTEEPVRIAFLLTVSGRALRQIQRLLKNLYHSDHYYYIHVDVREDYLFRELLPLEKLFPNIRVARHRFATIWGGASLLKMLISCMRQLLAWSDEWHWDFVINLSESDYPVKSVGALQQFLTRHRGHNFVKSHGRELSRFLQKQGLDKAFVECDFRMWRVADRQLPTGVTLDGGSDWVALSRGFVAYFTQTNGDALVSGLRQMFEYTLLPAESFFHTLLRSSQYCHTYIDNNLHVTNWKRKLGCKCQYKSVVDWCGCSPNDFRLDDWSRIEATLDRHVFFARKFEPVVNQAVIRKLEMWLHNISTTSNTATAVENLHAYWQNVYHSMDLSPMPDDALITLATSALRLLLRTGNFTTQCTNNNNNNNSNSPPPSVNQQILQVNNYFYNDSYMYTLIRSGDKQPNGSSRGGLITTEIEFALKPLPPLADVEFLVSSDFDEKEQMSRNFPRILSTYTNSLLLIYRFDHTLVVANLTCLWFNPRSELVDVSKLSTDEYGRVGFVKSNLKPPHLPGVWTVKVVHRKILTAKINFVIMPLQFHGGADITDTVIPFKWNSATVDLSAERQLHSAFIDQSTKQSDTHPVKGTALLDWIDSLVLQFYEIVDVCMIYRQVQNVCLVPIRNCSSTIWSSISNDPKSLLHPKYLVNKMFTIL